MKNGFNVSQTSNNSTVISLNEQGINTLKYKTQAKVEERAVAIIDPRINKKDM